MNIPMSRETEAILRTTTDETLGSFYSQLSGYNTKIAGFEKMIEFASSQSNSTSIMNDCSVLARFIEVGKWNMLITMFHLDLSVIINLFLNGKSEFEKIFALKQGMVIINEGYKKIFNFVTTNKDGSLNLYSTK